MAEISTEAAGARPFSYEGLEPLTAGRHARWRVATGDFSHASGEPFVPVLLDEFAQASRTYPIVFSAADPSPIAILGLERANLFVKDGAWTSDLDPASATGEGRADRLNDAYVPAFVRRYPFALLRVSDDRHALAIDAGSALVRKDGDEGEALFIDGAPAPMIRNALAFCEAFRVQAEATIAFVRALEARDLLIERLASIALASGRNLGLNGFRIVDAERFARLDGPTIVEWHAKGWLAPVHFHLTSLDRLGALARRQALRDAGGAPEAGARPEESQQSPIELASC